MKIIKIDLINDMEISCKTNPTTTYQSAIITYKKFFSRKYFKKMAFPELITCGPSDFKIFFLDEFGKRYNMAIQAKLRRICKTYINND